MNKLPVAKRVQILSMLCDSSSMRSINPMMDASINTISAQLVDAGKACAKNHDETMRSVRSKRIQADEIWSFRYAKKKNVAAVGLRFYLDAEEGAFGADVDYAQLMTHYGDTSGPAGRYCPVECTGIRKTPVAGNPDKAHHSTSCAERQNITMRMSMCRFTRLTNAFSKTAENRAHLKPRYIA